MSAVCLAPGPVAEAPVTPRYLTPKQAARYTNIAMKTLEFYRRAGKGPPFSVIGRSILYGIAELDAYMASRKVSSTAQASMLPAEGGAA